MRLLLHKGYCFSYALRSPIDLDLLKQSQLRVEIQNRCRSRFKSNSLPADLFSQYEQFRQDLYMFQKMSQQSNELKKQLKHFIKLGQSDETQTLKQKLSAHKQALSAQENKLKQSKTATESLLSNIGNTVHSATPISIDEKDNKVLRYYHPNWGVKHSVDISNIAQFQQQQYKKKSKKEGLKNYETLTEQFGIADLTRGQKVSGHRGYFLLNNGVKLALALSQYGLDFLEKKGYSCYQTPALILESVLRDSCQLQSIQTEMYRFREDDLCLIATSEQTLAGYFRGETFQPKQIPKKMAGYSSCFRREAGAHGKDIHGLFRVHQFEKVEQFVICKPEESYKEMEGMVHNAQTFYQSLGIPYRIVDIVSGELNDAAARKIDLEAWFPGQGKFRELVSVSNCTDYQSRFLETKMREGQGVVYPHMLNGTLVAIQRAMTCLLEHCYSPTKQGLVLPESLRQFARCSTLYRPQS